MPIPVLPIGLAALAGAALWRAARPARIDQRAEDALDSVDEGLGLGVAGTRSQANADGRWRRVLRMGQGGPGLEIDLALLARLRMRRI